MPPERFAGVSDVRGDIYGVGITLYELLTRRRAYEGDDAGGSRDAHSQRGAEAPPRAGATHSAGSRDDRAQGDGARRRAALRDRRSAGDGPARVSRRPADRGARPHRRLSPSQGDRPAQDADRDGARRDAAARGELRVVRARSEEEGDDGRACASTRRASAPSRRPCGPATCIARRETLDEAPPEFRNWEWRHLRSRLDPTLRRFESLPDVANDVTYHPDGTHFAVVVGDEVRVYADATGEVVSKLTTDGRPRWVRWHPRAHQIAVGTSSALELWTWPGCERTFVGEELGDHASVDYVNAGTQIVSGIDPGIVVCYDAETGMPISRGTFPARVLATVSFPDADLTVVGTADGRVWCKRRSDWATVWSHALSRYGIDGLAVLPGERVAVTTRDGLLRVFEAQGGRELHTFPTTSGAGGFLHDPTGRRTMVFDHGKLRVLDDGDGKELYTLSGHPSPHRGAVHPEGRRAIVASSWGAVGEWYLGETRDPYVLTGHMDDVGTADCGARFVASGGFGGEVRLWEVATGELARVFYGTGGVVNAVRLSPGERPARGSGQRWIHRDLEPRNGRRRAPMARRRRRRRRAALAPGRTTRREPLARWVSTNLGRRNGTSRARVARLRTTRATRSRLGTHGRASRRASNRHRRSTSDSRLGDVVALAGELVRSARSRDHGADVPSERGPASVGLERPDPARVGAVDATSERGSIRAPTSIGRFAGARD